jgi:hypothetical protein
MTDWSHPRLANPACRLNAPSEDIAAEARAAFERRRDTYPQMVQAKQLLADDARADLEAWRAIAKDWHWIATGNGEPAGPETLEARTAALDTAIARWIERADRQGGRMTDEENEQVALLCAMRIWAGRERTWPYYRHIRGDAEGWRRAIANWRAKNAAPTLDQERTAA